MHKVLRTVFNLFQAIKINILPKHFYSSIPDFSFLSSQEFWKKKSSLHGVNGTDIQSQIEFTKQCLSSVKNKSILENENILSTATKEQNEQGYGVLEADFLYSFVQHQKPKKIIQIGCGISSSIILRAADEINHSVKLVCVEPYPSEYLKKLSENKKITLIDEAAQTVPLEKLIDLEKGDFLFIDSTHTVKVGSEVNRVILEVLPRLKKGVFVHFHDIYFPYDYQRNLQSTTFFWGESTLLHAFLINNQNYTIRHSQSMLHYAAKDTLKTLFPNYNPQEDQEGLPANNTKDKHFPASTYLEVI